MLTSIRLPAVAALALAVAACSGFQSSSPGYMGVQSPSAGFGALTSANSPGIVTKCDDLTDAFQRANCHVTEREEIERRAQEH